MYTPVPSGTPVSEFLELFEDNFVEVMAFQRGSTEPTVKPTGTVWFDSAAGVMKQWNGSTWSTILTPYKHAIVSDGSVALTGNLPAGSNKITGLASGTASGDAVHFGQVATSDGTRLAYGTALAHYNSACQIQQYVDQAATYERCGYDNTLKGRDFVPREIKLRLTGNVINQSDSSVLGTMDEELSIVRWNGLTGGTTTIASVTVGAYTIDVIVEFHYTNGQLGFYLRLVRQDDGDEWCDVATCQCWATGINELITFPY